MRHLSASRPHRAGLAASASLIALAVAAPAAAQSPLYTRRAPDAGAAAARAIQLQSQQSQRATALAQTSGLVLARALQTTAAMNRLQAEARAAALRATDPGVPNGLQIGGLAPRIGAGLWENAEAPTQVVGERTAVTVVQTAQRAILTWDTFNVGRATDLRFDQSRGGADARQWSVLNRVEDPSLAPSRILGSIRAEGQVLVINRNGVIFSGTAQVDTATFVASAFDVGNWDNTSLTPQARLDARNGRFRTGFLDSASGGQPSFSLDSAGLTRLLAANGAPTAAVEVEAGARISSTGTEGTVILAAPRVVNRGTVVSPSGQVVLAAGAGLYLQAPRDGTADLNSIYLYPRIGYRVEALRRPDTGNAFGNLDALRSEVVNEGLVSSSRGNVTLAGFSVVNAAGAVISATTANNRPGSIFLVARDLAGTNPELALAGGNQPAVLPEKFRLGQVLLEPGSVVDISAETGADQVVFDGAGAFQQSRLTLNGAFVALRTGAIVRAPAASLRIAGDVRRPVTQAEGVDTAVQQPTVVDALTGRLQAFVMERDAVIDVGGVKGVEIPVARNILQVDVRNNILQNAPLQRSGFFLTLSQQRRTVTVDARNANAILDVTPFVNGIPRGVEERQARGGSLTIEADDIFLLGGSRIDVSGGWISYQGGLRPTETRLLGSDGRVYQFSRAPADITFIGIAGESIHTQPRWGVSELFLNPLIARRQIFEAGYLEGFDAGSVTLTGRPFLDGVIEGAAQVGRRQIVDSRANDGNAQTSGDLPRGGALSFTSRTLVGLFAPLPTVVNPTLVTQIDAPLPDDFLSRIDRSTLVGRGSVAAANDPRVRLTDLSLPAPARGDRPEIPLPAERFDTLLPVRDVLGRGFTTIVVNGQGLLTIPEGVRLDMPAQYGGPDGGPVTGPRLFISAGQAVIAGAVVAPGGGITIDTGAGARIVATDFVLDGQPLPYGTRNATAPADATEGTLVVASTAVLSTAGRWINDTVVGLAGGEALGAAFVNAGTIDLITRYSEAASRPQVPGVEPTAIGVRGRDIRVQSGAVLDVSGGGFVSSAGALTAGAGGTLRLRTYAGSGRFVVDAVVNNSPVVQLATVAPVIVAIGPYARPVIEDGARLLGFGLAVPGRGAGNPNGGRLDIGAGRILLGRTATAEETAAGVLALDLDRFAAAGFSDFRLNTFVGTAPFRGTDAGDLTVADGARIAPIARSRVPVINFRIVPSGTPLEQFSTETLLAQTDRPATRLWLTAGNRLLLGDAATEIIADPGGIRRGGEEAIRLETPRELYVAGRIEAPAGSIILAGTGRTGVYGINTDLGISSDQAPGFEFIGTEIEFARQPSLWIASTARISATGIAQTVPDARTGLPAGSVRPAGTVTLQENRFFLVVERGAVIDVSGAVGSTSNLTPPTLLALAGSGADSLDLPGAGGTIRINGVRGAFIDGTLRGAAGGPGAVPGTLVIQAPSTSSGGGLLKQPFGAPYSVPNGLPGLRDAIILVQDGPTLPPGATFNGRIDPTLTVGPQETQSPFTRPFASDYLNRTIFAANQLDGSGIGRLVLDGTLLVQGDVTLTVPRVLQITGIGVTDVVPATSGGAAGAARVRLVSDYVVVNGQNGRPTPAPTTPGSALAIESRVLDIFGGLGIAGFENTTLVATTDLRLSPTARLEPLSTAALNGASLVSDGNLTLVAGRIYPSTGTSAAIRVLGPNGTDGRPGSRTLRIERPVGAPALGTPLSAGGALLLQADTIEQFGTVLAPGGSISFVHANPVLASPSTNARIVFGAGSITSVSLGGREMPYGQTRGGPSASGFELVPSIFIVNANLGNAGLSAPPAKEIRVNTATIQVDPGASFDAAGGGELLAYRFVPGPLGNRDVLARFELQPTASSSTAPSNPTVGAYQFADQRDVFAILPGAQPSASPISPFILDSGTSLGRGEVTALPPAIGTTNPLLPWVGDSIAIGDDVPGLAAGTYTLLPARYAIVPGAYRVVIPPAGTTPSVARDLARPFDAPIGSTFVSAQRVLGITGQPEARTRIVEFQPEATWRQFSDIVVDRASAFFAARAARSGGPVPRLPIDAGRLSLIATAGLSLAENTANFARGPGGRGGLVEISTDRLAVTPGGAPLAGFIAISDAALSSLGAESLTLGGGRTDPLLGDPAGVRLGEGGVATAVRIVTGSILTAPEIVLVARGTADGDGIVVEAGARVEASGLLSPGSDVPFLVGRTERSNSGFIIAPALPGDAAVLRVAAGPVARVLRENAGSLTPGITLGSGATLAGGSLLLDALGSIAIATDTSFAVGALDLVASTIRLGDAAPTAGGGARLGSLQLAQLAQAADLALRSRTGIQVFGPGTVLVGAGRSVTFDTAAIDGFGDVRLEVRAGESIQLRNGFGGTPAAPGTGAGTLDAQAGTQLGFGTGATRLTGFADARFATPGAAVLAGPVAAASTPPITPAEPAGALTTAGNLEIAAALITVAPGADFSLTVGGNLVLAGPAPGTTPTLPQAPIGGRLVAQAASIALGTTLRIHGGTVDLTATAGNITLSPGAVIDLTGLARQFFDVVRYAPGGLLRATAQTGSVVLEGGATIDVSAARPDLEQGGLADFGSDAGAIALTAQLGAVGIDAGVVLRGLAGPAARGGEFVLDSGGAVTLSTLNDILDRGGPGSFAGGRQVRTRVGDLVVEAGRTMRAAEVVLVADGGTVRVDAGGLIDASGAKGGRIELYGTGGVTVAGTLRAVATTVGERGGMVTIGTSGTGTLQLDGAGIDVSGFQPLYGSLVRWRLPVGQVSASSFGATVSGARRVEVEPFVTRTVGSTFGIADVEAGWADVTGALNGLVFPNAPAGIAITPGVEIVSAGNLTLPSGRNDADIPLDLNVPTLRFGDEAGVLTVRSAGTLTVLSSITDGFQARSDDRDTRDTDESALNNWFLDTGRSFSLRLVGGAALGSANPLSTSVAFPGATLVGDVLIGPEYVGSTTTNPRVVRTGTGSIDIAAGRSVRLRDPDSTVYTAGRSIVDPTIVNGIDAEGNPVTGSFLLPQAPTYLSAPKSFTPPAAYPASYLEGGGDLRVTAREDILGDVVRPTRGLPENAGEIVTAYVWREGAVAADDRTYLYRGEQRERVLGTGAICDRGSACLPAIGPSSTQSTWYIRLDLFNQNWGVLGGGDADFRAGRDFQGAISLPTTMRTGNGLRATYLDVDGNVLPTPFGTGPRVRSVDGGGDLRLDVGRDIRPLSQFHLGRGTGVLRVGDDVEQGGFISVTSTPVAFTAGTLFSLSDAAIKLTAGGSATVGVYDPLQRRATLFQELSDTWAAGGSSAVSRFSSYSSESLVDVVALAGEVVLTPDITRQFEAARRGRGNPIRNDVVSSSASSSFNNVLLFGSTLPSGGTVVPVTTLLTTFNGDIRIPVVVPTLDPRSAIIILAGGSLPSPLLQGSDIDLSFAATPDLPSYAAPLVNQGSTSDRNPVFSPDGVNYFPPSTGQRPAFRYIDVRSFTPIRAPDAPRSLLYARTGDITAAVIAPFTGTIGLHAGRDITDLTLRIQHYHPSDVSFAWADRDFGTAPGRTSLQGIGTTVAVAGPGRAQLIAGRDIASIRTPSGVADFFAPSGLEQFLPIGIRTFGNQTVPTFVDDLPVIGEGRAFLLVGLSDIRNPNLSDRGGASIDILFGIGAGGGFDARGFLDRYLDPARARPGDITYRVQEVRDGNGAITFAIQPAAGTTTSPETLARIRGLDQARQLSLAIDLYFRELDASGLEANLPGPTLNSYARGYNAEAALFPFRGTYGGNFNLQGTFVRTENGGDINVLGAGGDFFLGATSVTADPDPSRIGVLTLDYGAINIYAYGDIQVGQARALTVNGGNVILWSSTRDINAGQGARTTRSIPPFTVQYFNDLFREGLAAGLVSGSGIATLVPFTLPEDVLALQDFPQNEAQAFAIAEQVQARRNPRINLVAPIGAIDFGDAGVRSAGNLNVAALVVRNAESAAAAGSTTGVPTVQAPNVSAAIAGSAAVGSNTNSSTEAGRRTTEQNRGEQRQTPATIDVRVIGFGATAEEAAAAQ